MAFFRSSVLVLAGLAAGGVLLLAHRVAQETGKGLAESLTDVPTEAQALFTDVRGRAEEAVDRGREAYYQKQAEIDEQLEDLSQAQRTWVEALVKDHASETVVLRAEKSRASIPLLRLVIGGVAARRSVGVDQLDDLQLAVETLVVEERSYGGRLTLEIRADATGLRLRLDGLSNSDVRALLRSPGSYEPSEGHFINVRMLLDCLVDAYSVEETEEREFAVQLEKWTSQVTVYGPKAIEERG